MWVVRVEFRVFDKLLGKNGSELVIALFNKFD